MENFQLLLTIQTVVFYGLFFVSGLFLKFFPPKKNRFYGFRTNKALESDENWFFAQGIASGLIVIFSISFFFISIFIKYLTGFLYQAFTLYTIIDTLLLLVATFMIYFLTEDKLRRKYRQEMNLEPEIED